MASSPPSFKELLKKGEVVEVTSVGTVCGLEEHEYCVRDKCEYWDGEKNQCTLFVWISIMYEGEYRTLIMRREKAEENMKLARFLK